jgi:hypothetical protein
MRISPIPPQRKPVGNANISLLDESRIGRIKIGISKMFFKEFIGLFSTYHFYPDLFLIGIQGNTASS